MLLVRRLGDEPGVGLFQVGRAWCQAVQGGTYLVSGCFRWDVPGVTLFQVGHTWCRGAPAGTHLVSNADYCRQGDYDGRGQPTASPMLTAIMSGGVGISGRELYKYR